jgi:exopolysaccharide biosynthesis polyprenyl glycosylphosphotransferase
MSYDEKSKQAGRLLLVLDALLTAFVFLVTFRVQEVFLRDSGIDLWEQLSVLPLIMAVLVPILWYSGAYERMRIGSLFSYAWIVARTIIATFLVVFTTLFLLRAQYASRVGLLVFGVLLAITLVTVRGSLIWWYFRKAQQTGENFLKVLIIGTGDRARRLSAKLHEKSEWGLQVIGYLDVDNVTTGARVDDAPVLGTVDQIASLLERHVVDEVIVAVPRAMLSNMQVIADVCEDEGVKLRLMADVFDLKVSRMGLVNLDEIPLLTFEPVAQDEVQLIIKRIFDLSVTLAAMPVLLPIFLVIGIAVRLDSPGPALFTQERVGLRKRKFRMYKFRSMYQDAEQRLKEIEHLNEAQGPIFKIANDPRITRVGRFIRKTSLDELPQLLNVLRGHMSLVGPRPMSLRDVGLFDQSIQRRRFSVRPGLTCIWQISGRSNLPFEKWLELDLAYIDNWSVWLDLKILLKTIPIVLKGSGAV